jgi:hypothetical protein
MTTKHTPGPWSERIRNDLDATIQGAGGEIVAFVNLIHCDGFGNDNTRLIAAAPDLLAALKRLLDPGFSGRHSAEQQARAALAKAEGKS